MRRVLHSLFVLSLVSAAGCQDFPSDRRQEIHDLRILAMRLDPPELELPLDDTAPPLDVSAAVLVAAPDRSPVSVTFTGCPWRVDDVCEGFDPAAVENPETGELYPATLFEPFTTVETSTESPPAADAVPEVRPGFTRSLPVPLLGVLLTRDGLSAVRGARPTFQVDVESDGGFERAFKRLQVSFPDTIYRVALGELGVELCDAQGQPAGCIDWQTRVPNTNPTFTAVSAAIDEDPAVDLDPAVPLTVPAGAAVTLTPALTPGDAEPYQTLAIDLDTQSVELEDRDELLTFGWFTTAGSLDYAETEEDATEGIENVWTAPEEAGLVYLWVVVRDTRGGQDFVSYALDVVAN